MQSINEVFLELDTRIKELKKLPHDRDGSFHYKQERDYDSNIYQIESNINRFKSEAVSRLGFTIEELNKLDSMGIDIINNTYFSNDEFEYEKMGDFHVPVPKIMKLSNQARKKYYEMVKPEIHFYLEKLRSLKKIYEEQGAGNIEKPVSITIGEEFNFPNLKVDYPEATPILTQPQWVLLFYYLKRNNIILPYDQLSMSKIIMMLTGYSLKSARLSFSELKSIKGKTPKKNSGDNKINLQILKDVLSGIIHEIDKDLNLPKK